MGERGFRPGNREKLPEESDFGSKTWTLREGGRSWRTEEANVESDLSEGPGR